MMTPVPQAELDRVRQSTAAHAAAAVGAPYLEPRTKWFNGKYRLLRNGGGKTRVLHSTFEKAEAEARRLLGKQPDASFVIMQEIARVKMETVI